LARRPLSHSSEDRLAKSDPLSKAVPWMSNRTVRLGQGEAPSLTPRPGERALCPHGRRLFLQSGVALVELSLLSHRGVAGQPAAKAPRIGFRAVGARAGRAFMIEGLLQGLQERSYVEGQNILIEYRFSEDGRRPCAQMPNGGSGRQQGIRGGRRPALAGVGPRRFLSKGGHSRGQDPQGRRPATLPMEQPTKFELFVNLKTARSLGLTILQYVLLQATHIIQ
jgi:hypothetical protein